MFDEEKTLWAAESDPYIKIIKQNIMKGKILSINPSGSWESPQYGTMYTYMVKLQTMNDLEFEGQANAKSETLEGLPYKVGEEVEFEHEESNSSFPNKLKIKKEGSGQYSSGGKKKDNRSFALSYAKDLAVARISISDPVGPGMDFTDTNSIIKQADAFVKWLDS